MKRHLPKEASIGKAMNYLAVPEDLRTAFHQCIYTISDISLGTHVPDRFIQLKNCETRAPETNLSHNIHALDDSHGPHAINHQLDRFFVQAGEDEVTLSASIDEQNEQDLFG